MGEEERGGEEEEEEEEEEREGEGGQRRETVLATILRGTKRIRKLVKIQRPSLDNGVRRKRKEIGKKRETKNYASEEPRFFPLPLGFLRDHHSNLSFDNLTLEELNPFMGRGERLSHPFFFFLLLVHFPLFFPKPLISTSPNI